jgi:hypothetical protein
VIFVPKIYVGSKKPNKTRLEVGFFGFFLGGFFWVLLSGFFWAGFLLPTLITVLSLVLPIRAIFDRIRVRLLETSGSGS